MAIPDHNNNNYKDLDLEQDDAIDQWFCSQCFKTISSSRPPVFNPENCSCVEIAGSPPSPNQRAGGEIVEQPLYHYDNTGDLNPLYHNRAQSYASSALSFRGPEGPEREGVDLRVGNGYSPVGFDVGCEESQLRGGGGGEGEGDMSYPMRRFLVEDGYAEDIYATEREVGRGLGFRQDGLGKMRGSKKAKKGSKRSWDSEMTTGRRGSEDVDWNWGQRVEGVRDVGSWVDGWGSGEGYGGVEMRREGGVYNMDCRYQYPLCLSGATDFGEDGR